MQFLMQDLEKCTMSFTLWDDYVDAMLPYMEEGSTHAVTVIIQFGRISIFGDQVRVCNTYNVTKVIVNGEGDDFKMFNKSLIDSGAVESAITTFATGPTATIAQDFKTGQVVVKNLAELTSYEKIEAFDYIPKEVEERLSNRVGLFKVQVKESDQLKNSISYSVLKMTDDDSILASYRENYVDKKKQKMKMKGVIIVDATTSNVNSENYANIGENEDESVTVQGSNDKIAIGKNEKIDLLNGTFGNEDAFEDEVDEDDSLSLKQINESKGETGGGKRKRRVSRKLISD